METEVLQQSASPQANPRRVGGGGGRVPGGVMFAAPVLGVAGACILGGLWGSGLLSGGPLWVGLLFFGLTAVGPEFLVRRYDARSREAGAGTCDEMSRDSLASPVVPMTGSVGTSLVKLLDGVGVAFLVTDSIGTVLRASSTVAELLECDPDEHWSTLNRTGTFFGLPVEDQDCLAGVQRFFSGEADNGEGLVTTTGSRRQIRWAGRVMDGSEGLGTGRMLILSDITAEQQFEVLKRDFFATISHELRTPLTSLRGSLQLVVGRSEGLETMDRQLLEISIKNSEKLIGLINDLLDIDALEQDSIAFQFATLEIGELISAAREAVIEACMEREVRVEIERDEELPAIHGDRDRLFQVMLSLLGNAVKHAPPDSTITIRARGCDTGLQVDVCDCGVGIPVAEQPHVFERFWRVDRTSTDAGAGLGLAICRAVVARHGGQIWLESEEGKGATFSFFLPRSVFRLERDEGAKTAAEIGEESVLLVEGDADSRAVLQTSLERCGYRVTAVPSGAQGVAAARRDRPAAVILDLVLPDISGHDVLRILKNSPDTAAVPVLVLSVESDRELARKLGAWNVLQKPLDLEAVQGSLKGALRRADRPEGRLVLALGPAVSRDLTILASVLEADGHKVHRALDLCELARWVESNYPDAVVLDDDFLSATPAEAAEQLGHPDKTHCIPLVFLTTHPDDDEEASLLSIRLRKPISKEDFIGAVRRVLADSRDGTGHPV